MSAPSRETSAWVDEYVDSLHAQPQLQAMSLRQFTHGQTPMATPEIYTRYEPRFGLNPETGSEPMQMISTPQYDTDVQMQNYMRRMEPIYVQPPISAHQPQGLGMAGQALQGPEYSSTRNSSVASDRGAAPQLHYKSSSVSAPYGQADIVFNSPNYAPPLVNRASFQESGLPNIINKRPPPPSGVHCAGLDNSIVYIDGQDRYDATPRDFPHTVAAESAPVFPSSGSAAKKRPRKRLNASQRQAHNTIEKRYRVKINAKITELNELVPMCVPGKLQPEARSPVQQGANAARLNKSMTLERATDYIAYLKSENSRLEQLVAELSKQHRPSHTTDS